ncbi:MAG TPA: UDP-2,3-diacylglucosamine diphosphatase [bacterium]|nr:UDP-2,3-diacylglucosamine diphosphatase [bacterium]
MANYVFISDIHLNYNFPEKINNFGNFLISLNNKINTLFILGDLFDFWFEHPLFKLSEKYQLLKSYISKLSYKIIFVPGNRDFFIGSDFSSLTNFNIIHQDYYLAKIFNKNILLTHGDLLCSNDFRYLLYRKFIRNKTVISILKYLPAFLILSIIKRLHTISIIEKKIKNKKIQKYNEKFILEKIKSYNADYLIAGHIHELFIKKINNKIIGSCGNWSEKKGTYILLTEDNIEIKEIKF